MNENSRDSKEDQNFDLLPETLNVDQMIQEMNQNVTEERLDLKQKSTPETPVTEKKPHRSGRNSKIFMKLHN